MLETDFDELACTTLERQCADQIEYALPLLVGAYAISALAWGMTAL